MVTAMADFGQLKKLEKNSDHGPKLEIEQKTLDSGTNFVTIDAFQDVEKSAQIPVDGSPTAKILLQFLDLTQKLLIR
jgi:hypothetical protein